MARKKLKDILRTIFQEKANLNIIQVLRSHSLTTVVTFFLCFTYETPILTSDGQKAIGEIKIGDKVWSKDQLTGKVSLKPVTNVFVHQVNSLLNLWVKGQKLTTTKNHIFYVAGKGWIEAGQILSKDKVMMKDGSLEEVTQTDDVALTEAVNVYNFEVADWHTYFVGQGILVHNQSTNGCSEAIGKLFGDTADALIWKGSGPVPGVLGVNANSKSVEAIKNYYPKDGGIEFVFDPKTNTFVVGKPQNGLLQGSAHQQLARSIGADESTVLGGTFSRGTQGEIYTTENSGHYGEHWTDQLRQQFQNVMKEYGLPLIHEKWGQ